MSQPLLQNQKANIKKPKLYISLQARLLRRVIRRSLQTLRHGSLHNSPILFANSFPKSGTHLLTQVLKGFSQLGAAVNSGLPAITTFDGSTGRQRSHTEIMVDLMQLLPGDISYGHIHAFPEALTFLCQDGVAAYFILRDPRDVVVSHVHYVAKMAPNHILHRYYHETLKTFDERLCTSIEGVSAEELSDAMGIPVPEPLPNIRERFEPYIGWLGCPEILSLRYEDFINQQQDTIKYLLEHAINRGFVLNRNQDEAIRVLEESIDPLSSPTFRSGRIGEWSNWFNAQHKILFKQISSDLLFRLGYEFIPDW